MNKTEILPGTKQKRTPVLGEVKADREVCRQGRLLCVLGKVGLPELVRAGRRRSGPAMRHLLGPLRPRDGGQRRGSRSTARELSYGEEPGMAEQD